MKISFEGLDIELSKNGDTYGIDNLKLVAGNIYQLWEKIVKRSKGGFNFIEIIQTGINITGEVSDILANINDLRNEIQDLSEKEVSDLVLYFMQRFDISNTDAREIIEFAVIEGIDLVFSGIRIYNFVKSKTEKK